MSALRIFSHYVTCHYDGAPMSAAWWHCCSHGQWCWHWHWPGAMLWSLVRAELSHNGAVEQPAQLLTKQVICPLSSKQPMRSKDGVTWLPVILLQRFRLWHLREKKTEQHGLANIDNRYDQRFYLLREISFRNISNEMRHTAPQMTNAKKSLQLFILKKKIFLPGKISSRPMIRNFIKEL